MYHFKRNKQPLAANGDLQDVTVDNSASFKYKSGLLTGLTTEDGGDGVDTYRIRKTAQILVPLKYVSSFFGSVEIILINTKLHLELSYTENCIMSNEYGASTFKITKTEFYVPIASSKSSDSSELSKLISKGFKQSIF